MFELRGGMMKASSVFWSSESFIVFWYKFQLNLWYNHFLVKLPLELKVTKLRSLLRKNWTKDVSLNLAPAALDRFENIVPNFFPTRCFVFFELSLLVSLSNLSNQGVEDIIHMAPGRTNCKKNCRRMMRISEVRWPVSGAGLVEGAVELVSKWETLFSLHQSLGLLQIHLKQTVRYLR